MGNPTTTTLSVQDPNDAKGAALSKQVMPVGREGVEQMNAKDVMSTGVPATYWTLDFFSVDMVGLEVRYHFSGYASQGAYAARKNSLASWDGTFNYSGWKQPLDTRQDIPAQIWAYGLLLSTSPFASGTVA